MAKKPQTRTSVNQDRSPPQVELDDVDRLLIELASALLAEYFFDPDNEAGFLALYPSRRAPANAPPLTEDTLLLDAEDLEEGSLEEGGLDGGELEEKGLDWRLDVLGSRNAFRVTMRHPTFSVTIEGIWQFKREALRQARVVQRTGDPAAITAAVEAMLEHLSGSEPSEEELEDLLAALSEGDESPLIGDDPREPPPASSTDRERVRAMVRQLAGKADRELRMEDRSWLEMRPQTLPVLTELLVEAMTAQPRQERRIAVCLSLVALQLEFVRYRLDRGWDWASRMLNDYQQTLISLGTANTLEQTDWFGMASVLSEARVPVSDAIQTALAEAGMTLTNPGPPAEMMTALRGLSDELAAMVETPFDVIGSLSAAGAVMPATLRCFMATELALSPHAVLREAVPMMLLDGDSSVRRAAAAAMEQTAGADTVSPDWLRRAITLRNWIPAADRPELDRAIRKARGAGVPIGMWPAKAAGSMTFHASMVDGSGAQSILAVSRTGRKGLVAGVLLKHGVGVVDAWLDTTVTRSGINQMLREIKGELPSDEVERGYVDAAVQHAIAQGLTQGSVPGDKLLAIAECVGFDEWKDRGLDIAAEAATLFDRLPASERTPAAVDAALARGADWMLRQPIAASWFEDDPTVRGVIARVPRKDNAGAIRLVLSEILPAKRLAWAERFLLMALWCQAAADKEHRAWADDFVVLTDALTGDRPLDAIPIMASIATQTVMAARTSGW